MTNRIINSILNVAIAICIALSAIILLSAVTPSARASAEEATVPVSYTPTFDTQYVVSAPTGLTLNQDGSATTLSINITSWKDFPTDRALYCNLAGVTALTNGKETLELAVKNNETPVAEGDEICRFIPSTVDSDISTPFFVLMVASATTPSQSGTYSGNLSFEFGVVE